MRQVYTKISRWALRGLATLGVWAGAARLQKPRESSLRSLQTSKMLENARSEASRRRKCSKMLVPKPPDVEKRSKMLAPKPLDVEKCSKMLAPKPLGVEKCFHGAERIIEKEIEKEFEKEFRSPALEDASLKEASLNDASLYAFNARPVTVGDSLW